MNDAAPAKQRKTRTARAKTEVKEESFREEMGPTELTDPLIRTELKKATVWIGMATLVVQMNAPPSHGDFSACRKEAAASTCVSTGKAILDSFRLSCDGWIDSDLPLTFIFGYSLASSNASAAASAGTCD